ncbi:MAG: MSHA biogenesis protein MshE [Gammaproteobacteria bacterium]|nr:MSHA biogenesis protein MshE [Gammaproteobacteria bacterium]
MNTRKKIRLGDLCIENGLISQEQLDEALAEQKKSGRKLGRILIENSYIKEDDMLEILSRQLKIPFVDLLHYKFKPEVIKLIPEIQARRFRALALSRDEQSITVGMADPTNIFAYDELSNLLKQQVRLAVVRESDLLRTIDTVYRKTEQISGFAEQLSDELSEGDIDLAELVSEADVTDAPVVKLLQSLFADAIQIGASDIHIEPDETLVRIRQRVDGVLQEQVVEETNIAAALVSRLKLIANLDISEKRLPQDGRFSIKVDSHNVDVRISTMPIQNGESVVMRLLDQTRGTYDLESLGMPEAIVKSFRHAITRPHGMVLVTGPTGSGKTTSLYAGLKLLNTPHVKIITAEDPIEYRLSRINQVQINTDIGLSFANVLRSALRQDPDVLLVGEIRDEETAEIAIRASMTGHLVLSTLHTNSAIGTVNRLIDMEVKPYLLAAALNAIVAQRLVRKICRSCGKNSDMSTELTELVKKIGGEQAINVQYAKGAGCAHCNATGYQGRIGVYEFLNIDQQLASVLGTGDTAGFTTMAREKAGFSTLEQAALKAAMDGITTLDEVLRVSADIDNELSQEPPVSAELSPAQLA